MDERATCSHEARTCETCERADSPANRVRHYLDAADAWDECDECRDGADPIRLFGVASTGWSGRRDEELYRGYHIYHDPPPIPIRTHDWQWYHDDYDGAPDGNDHRCGSSGSLEAAKADIDEQIEEDE